MLASSHVSAESGCRLLRELRFASRKRPMALPARCAESSGRDVIEEPDGGVGDDSDATIKPDSITAFVTILFAVVIFLCFLLASQTSWRRAPTTSRPAGSAIDRTPFPATCVLWNASAAGIRRDETERRSSSMTRFQIKEHGSMHSGTTRAWAPPSP